MRTLAFVSMLVLSLSCGSNDATPMPGNTGSACSGGTQCATGGCCRADQTCCGSYCVDPGNVACTLTANGACDGYECPAAQGCGTTIGTCR